MTPQARARSQAKAKRILTKMALQELREARQTTQVKLAKTLNVNQAAVSKLERRTDMYISTLRSYVEAMRGKLDIIAREIPEPFRYKLAGPQEADLTIVSWGSTKGAILDALPALGEAGRVNFLQVRLMRPFPAAEIGRILSSARTTVLIEPNYSGQLGALIREQTGILTDHRVLKYDGRPFSRNEVVEGVEAVLQKNAREWMVSHA